MSAVDWIVFLGFLAYVVYDGIRRARTTKNLEGYFAGGRSIPWWAAGLSVMATQASAITVIGTSGQGHDGGMDFVQTYFGLPFAMILLCIFMVPLYRRLPILTAYEYLEGRFGPETRAAASLVFMIARCLAFGVVIYAPALVLSALLAIDVTWTVLFIGALTTVYTMIGGVHAVIWTDVKQMSVIIGGLLVCVGILLARITEQIPFGDILDVAGSAGKLNAVELEPESRNFVPRLKLAEDFEQQPRSFWEEKYNFWSGMLGGLFLMLAYFGTDQSQVQRILTNPSVRESRLALLLSAFAKIPMQVVVLFLGVLLWVFYLLFGGHMVFDPNHAEALARVEDRAVVERLEADYAAAVAERRELAIRIADSEGAPADLVRRFQQQESAVAKLRSDARLLAARQTAREAGVAEAELPDEAPGDRNYVFPTFILDELPPVLLGLLIAAIFAAAMSSSDSALNSITSAAVVDFYKRWLRPDADDRQSLRAGRVFTVIIGAFATMAALSFEGGGPVIVVNKIPSFFYGSLLGIFVLALFVPRAGRWSGLAGLVGGVASVQLANLLLEVEWLWYNIIGLLGVLLVGGVVAVFERRPAR